MQFDNIRVSRKLWGTLLGLVVIMALMAGVLLNCFQRPWSNPWPRFW